MNNDLLIEYRSPNDVVPNKHNARTHSKRQIDQIAQSITTFGFTNPILVDEDGVLIAGLGRLAAARTLSLERVPVISLIGLTASQKRALLLADNKLALSAGWDIDLLKVELSSLTDLKLDFNVEVTGFSSGEIDAILKSAVGAEAEDLLDVPSSTHIQIGDIWQLGDHLVGCGDCRDVDFLKALMVDRKADVAFLDPPYNVAIKGHVNVRTPHREFAMASGEMSEAEFSAFLTASLTASVSVSRNGAVHFVCMDWRHMDELHTAATSVYDKLLNLCVWKKSNAGMGSLYRSQHELVFVYRVGQEPHFNAVELGRHGRNRTNIWKYASVNSIHRSRREELRLHPTPKPIGMVADAICDVTRRGNVVLDTFLGSGTTLIAAERTSRVFVGCDIDPIYVDVALQRWSVLTGKTPYRIASAEARQ